MDAYIPLKTTKTLPHNKENILIKECTFYFNRLMNDASVFGWTRENLDRYKTLKNIIIKENVRLFNEKWEQTIKKTEEFHKYDPAKFWRSINTAMGGQSNTTPYLTDINNRKIYSAKDKIQLFKQYWENVFKISDMENQSFDQTTDQLVNNYVNQNLADINPYQTADLNRLRDNDPLLKPFTVGDIKLIIKKLKKKAPGHSKINKEIMERLPDSMVTELKCWVHTSVRREWRE